MGHQWLKLYMWYQCLYVRMTHALWMKSALPWTFLAMLHQCPASPVSWRGYFPLIQRRCHHWSCLRHLLPSWAEPPRWWRSEFESLDAIIQEGKNENGLSIYEAKNTKNYSIQVQHDRGRVGYTFYKFSFFDLCFFQLILKARLH